MRLAAWPGVLQLPPEVSVQPGSIVFSLILSLGAAACTGSSHPAPSPISPQARPEDAPVPAPAAAAAVEQLEPNPAMERKLEDLEFQVAQLTLTIEEMRNTGVGTVQAEHVAYQPNHTTLAARTVQDALDELWRLVDRQVDANTDMGEPGPGLFDLDNGPLGPRNPPGDKQDGPGEPPREEEWPKGRPSK